MKHFELYSILFYSKRQRLVSLFLFYLLLKIETESELQIENKQKFHHARL
jgi:hypothetical protein